MHTRWIWTVLFFVSAAQLRGDGPGDNLADKVRRVPPPGIKIADEDRTKLSAGAAELGQAIAKLRTDIKDKALLALLPDVQIFFNAVDGALKYDEFYNVNEVKVAYDLLKQGNDRAAALAKGEAPWASATGLIARGYVSRIDGSVQPYGLEVPKSVDPKKKNRLDFWFHGRGENLTELSFVNGRSKPTQTPGGTAITLHPYGRYCNANHFAGEIDTLECLTHVKKFYGIDDDRIVVRGFSMGGAACWNFAVHYHYKWAAAAPGAGFSETPDFLRVFQGETIKPTPYEAKLLHLYDCTDWAENLYNLYTVAYSGENDKQKQAADIMGVALKKEGMDLIHIIGPKTGHSYHPDSKAEINRLIDAAVAKGRNAYPKKIRFTTYTLRYNRSFWIRVDGLQEHWKRARVEADLEGDRINIKTENVTRLTLLFEKNPLPEGKLFKVTLDGKELDSKVKTVMPDSLTAYFQKTETGWNNAMHYKDSSKLEKRHLSQGPIDDAFMDRFTMIEPTGTSLNAKVAAWTADEMAHANEHWRRQFRGVTQRKKDTEITEDDIKDSNLILWGDPSSNAFLKKIADKLPIQWTARGIVVNDKFYEAGTHVPVLIYPNPLNFKRYIVVNSGFTFREYDYLNNARQVPKLPDWAVLDITQPRTSRQPAGIVSAGFFGEKWELTK